MSTGSLDTFPSMLVPALPNCRNMGARTSKHRERIDEETLAAREHMFGKFDTVIVSGGVHLPCHRDILMEQSSYFRSMFGQFREKSDASIELKDIADPKLMGQIINYMYFNTVNLSPRTVQDILSTASYLQIDSLTTDCVHYIKERMDKRNVVSIYLYTGEMGPWDLHLAAKDFILQNFEQVAAKSKEFSQLSRDQILSIISSPRLLVPSEGAVYKAVVSWVAHLPRERASILPSLLQHVHFPLMSMDEVEQSFRSHLVKKNKNLSTALQEARSYLAKNTNQKLDYWSSKPKPPRWPKIFVVMRMYWKNLPMEYYDFKLKSWKQLTPVQNWRSCTALVGHKHSIYLLGGEEVDGESPTGSRTVNRVTRYDCEKQRWTGGPSMLLARRWSGALVVDNTIYCIGGIGGKGGTYERRLETVESLELGEDGMGRRWKQLASMSTPRSSHTCEVMDGLIYVVGGGDGKDWLSSAEVYDPKKNVWRSIEDLSAKRWKCGLVHLGGYLYAVGGMDSPRAGFWGAPLNTVERYCPRTNKWTSVASMYESRFGCAVVAHQGRIYVSGGFGQDKAILSTVECYDPVLNKWSKLTGMRKMCGFVGGVLIDRPVLFETEEETKS